jgi:hypothetical protein
MKPAASPQEDTGQTADDKATLVADEAALVLFMATFFTLILEN